MLPMPRFFKTSKSKVTFGKIQNHPFSFATAILKKHSQLFLYCLIRSLVTENCPPYK